KDGNLMPANFGRYILMAMPMDIRYACINEECQRLGLFASVNDEAAEHGLDMLEICETNVAAAETLRVLTIAHADPTPENLAIAEQHAAQASARFGKLRKKIYSSR